MALYAFDGTWQEDEPEPIDDTNVARFTEAYTEKHRYVSGVGTRYGVIGRAVGGLFGVGGRTRIEEMYDELVTLWEEENDHDIDIVGFSRGAALAVHFANVVAKRGVRRNGQLLGEPRIRFLGVWDVVGSFGIPKDIVLNFHDINIGYDLEVPDRVDRCCHAMALHERRETFDVTRLDRAGKHPNVEELWFRGVHSDVGGGGGTPGLSSIPLGWMLARADDAGLPVDPAKMQEVIGLADPLAPISDNFDPFLDPRRTVEPHDAVHASARGKTLEVDESATFEVDARHRYAPTGVRMTAGAHYSFTIADDQGWRDGEISCGPDGWRSEDLPWYQQVAVGLFEPRRRCRKANWFELIGVLGDHDDHYFRIGTGGEDRTYTAPEDGMLYAFANDLYSRYGNNLGAIRVTVRRRRDAGAQALRGCGEESRHDVANTPR